MMLSCPKPWKRGYTIRRIDWGLARVVTSSLFYFIYIWEYIKEVQMLISVSVKVHNVGVDSPDVCSIAQFGTCMRMRLRKSK